MHNAPSTPTSSGWKYIATTRSTCGKRIHVPEAVVEMDLFDQRDNAHHGHNVETGTQLIAPGPLDLEHHVTVDDTLIGSSADNYRSTIPHQYRDTASNQRHIEMQDVDPSFGGVGTYHLLTHEHALEQDTPWAYVLSTAELEARLQPPAHWQETVRDSPKPRHRKRSLDR